MKISLVDVDGHGFCNLALMKLSAWHKAQGDTVDWYSPLFSHPDRIYASKVFTFTPDFYDYSPSDPEPIKGGTGYDINVKLPIEIESLQPDYSIYPQYSFAVGYLTRGCIRRCPWCVVPKKEGGLKEVGDIRKIGVRKNVILLDNNFLAASHDFIHDQLLLSQRMKLRIDFNQALDARLVNENNATLLADTRWIRCIRFSCDTESMLEPVERAVRLLRENHYRGEILVYVLAKEVESALYRIVRLTNLDKKIVPFCMPFKSITGDEPDANANVKCLARWCNIVSIRKSCTFLEYTHNIK